MRYNIVLRYVGFVMLLNAALMLLSAAVGYIKGFDSGFYPLTLSALLAAALGAFPLIFVGRGQRISAKESYSIVVGSWLMSCVVGMLPYLLWGGEFDVAGAWFESVSGYTTTGSTILNNVEALPRSLLMWRSLTHWMGGLGVVMFVMVVLPNIGSSKKTMAGVEISSMAQDNFRYKTATVLRIMLSVYFGITIASALLLRLAGMSWFDAVNHAFSVASTGGFSTRNLSVAAFDSVWIEVILSFFMILSGVHFGLIFATVTGKYNNMFRSEVVRYYLASVAIAGIIVSLSLWSEGIYGFWEAFRHGTFQTFAVASTTGFATADSTTWSSLAIVVLIFMSIQCACAGSTSGGMKCDRVCLAFKVIRARIKQQQHPAAVIRIKLNGVILDSSTVSFVLLFIVAYFAMIMLGSILMTACGMDLITGFTATIACIGNVGPGFGSVGSLDNFSGIGTVAKYICTILMLMGRLEIFGLVQLFLLKWWK